MQSAPAATSNHSSSGTSSATAAAARSCFGAGNSGGWDDSDEGGNGGDRPRFQAVKSHSLDAPDSAAVAVASSSETTPVNSRTNSSGHGSSSNTPGGSVISPCDTVPSGDMPLSPTTASAAAASVSELRPSMPPASLPASAAAPSSPLATTGPWQLNSPFAAAPAAVEPQHQQQSQTVSHPEPTAATGPWRLSSPFAAAPLPAFSSNLDGSAAAAVLDATPTAKSPNKKAFLPADTNSKQHQKDVTWQPQQQQQAKPYLEPPHICPPRPKTPKQQQQQSALPKGTTGPWALHSPFITVAAPPTLEVQQQAAASSSSPPPATAATGAAAEPFGSPLPAQFGGQDPTATYATAAPTSSTPTTAAGSQGNTPTKRERRKSRVGVPPTPPSPHTGPWALFSPFAAAVAAEAGPERSAQQQQAVEFGSNSNADQSAAVGKADRSGSGGSVRSDRSGAGAGHDSSSPTAAAGGFRGNTPTKRERRKSRLGVPPTPPSPHTGPWALFSPFAAAVAAEAAPERNVQQQQPVDPNSSSTADQSTAAADASVKTDRAGSGGSVRSERSGSGHVRSSVGQLSAGTSSPRSSAVPGQLSSSRDISVRLSDAAVAAPGSVHSVSEPRHSLAFSFPSVGISAGASSFDTAVTSAATSGGFDDGLDLDLQPTPMASMFWGGEGLSPVPSESELIMPELDDAKAAAAAGDQSEIKQQQQRMRHGRGARLHDSAHSHPMQQKVPIVAVQQQPVVMTAVPGAAAVPAAAAALAPKATTGPWALHSPFAAPAAADVADTAATAGGGAVHIAAHAAAAGEATYLAPAAAAAAAKDPMLLAPAPAAPPARIKTPVLLDPLAPATQAAESSPSAPAAADAAAVAAAAARPKNMSCLCCYPPSITEGQSTDVHVYIAGLDLPAPAAAADAVLRAVVARGSVIVADYTGICRPSDGLFRYVGLLLLESGIHSASCSAPTPCIAVMTAVGSDILHSKSALALETLGQGLSFTAVASCSATANHRNSAFTCDEFHTRTCCIFLTKSTQVFCPHMALWLLLCIFLHRVPVPGLPSGPLQLGIFLGKQLCFTQTLLVLPGPSAQEMILLWGSLLQSHLALQQEQQQQQILPRQQGSRQGSMAIRSESIGSGWNSQGSASSQGSGDAGDAAADGQQYHTVQEGFGVDGSSGAGGSWMPGVDHQQQQEGGIVGSVGGISSVDVQTVWQRQYTPVLTDIAYLLSAQIQAPAAASPSASTGGSPFAADGSSPRSIAAAAAGQSSINMETPKFKSMVTHLVQFLAANGLWAVLQLITDSVYGVGASAKALYTAKAATSAAASAAASVKGGGGSSGASSTTTAAAAAAKITQATQTATAVSTEIEVAEPAAVASSSDSRKVVADPAAAVAAAVAAVEAGQSLDLSAVLLLLLLAIRTSSKRGLAYCRAEGFVSVLQQSIRALGIWGKQLGLWAVDGVALLVLGLLWVYDSLSLLVSQHGRGQAGSAIPSVAPAPVDAAVSAEPVVDQGP